MKRRQFLQKVVSILALVAFIAVVIVFTHSLSPSLGKEQPYIEVNINEITPGTYRVVNWRDKQFVVVRTSEEMNKDLKILFEKTWNHHPLLGNEQFFAFSNVSTFRGCSLVHAPKGTRYPSEAHWLGGFFDPCHYGEWDYAGRSIKKYLNEPDTSKLPDLAVPKYVIVSGSVLRLYYENS